MRYQTIKIKLICGCNWYIVLDADLDVEIGGFKTAKEAQAFREAREQVDSLTFPQPSC